MLVTKLATLIISTVFGITVTINSQDLSELIIDAPLNSATVTDSDDATFYAGAEINSTYGFPGENAPYITISFCMNDEWGNRPFDEEWEETMSSEYQVQVVGFTGGQFTRSWTGLLMPSGVYYNVLSSFIMTPTDWDDFRPDRGYPTSPTQASLIAKIKITYYYFASPGPSNSQELTREYYTQFRIQ